MIPSTIFFCRFKHKNQILAEVSAQELAPTFFTFRIKKEKINTILGAEAELGFYTFDGDRYEKRMLSSGEYVLEILDEENPWFSICRLETENRNYRVQAMHLTREYTGYIYAKMEGDDAELSRTLTGYPVDEETIGASLEEQRKVWSADRAVSGLPEDFSYGIALQEPALWEAYLNKPFADFCTWYFETYGLGFQPKDTGKIRFLYFGSAFCDLLYPDDRIVELLDKAAAEHRTPVVSMSTLREGRLDIARERLDLLASWCQKKGVELELSVNDFGMLALLKERGDACFHLTLGQLPIRRRKDPRLPWKNGRDLAENLKKTSVNDPLYRTCLEEELGIERYSWERAGYPVEMNRGVGNTLYLPWYQTNTSTFCTLYASMTKGDRGLQQEVDACPGYCRNHAFLYPDDLGMVGKFNTIFGLDRDFVDKTEIWKELQESGVDRIVFNFL